MQLLLLLRILVVGLVKNPHSNEQNLFFVFESGKGLSYIPLMDTPPLPSCSIVWVVVGTANDDQIRDTSSSLTAGMSSYAVSGLSSAPH